MKTGNLYWPANDDRFELLVNEHVCEAIKQSWTDINASIGVENNQFYMQILGPEDPDDESLIFCPQFNILDELADFAKDGKPSYQKANNLKNLAEQILNLSIMLEKEIKND
jgi:hypothetical protein